MALPTGINLHSAWENYATAKSTDRPVSAHSSLSFFLSLALWQRPIGCKNVFAFRRKVVTPRRLEIFAIPRNTRTTTTTTIRRNWYPRRGRDPGAIVVREFTRVQGEIAQSGIRIITRSGSERKRTVSRARVRERRHKLSTQYGSKPGGDKRLLSDEN